MIIIFAVFVITLCVLLTLRKINTKNDIKVKVHLPTKLTIKVNLKEIIGAITIIKYDRCFNMRVSPNPSGLCCVVPIDCSFSYFITRLYHENIKEYEKQDHKRLLDVLRAIVGAEVTDSNMIAFFDDENVCEVIEKAREDLINESDYFFSQRQITKHYSIATLT